MKTIARFRCGNEWEGNRYWQEEGKKMCRLCERGEESWHHILKECPESRTANPNEEFIMAEDGKGIEWMLKLCNKRKERKKLKSQEISV